MGDKIFAFLGSESVGLKCGANRTEADEWLLQYPDDASVMPYIGRSGWNTLRLGGAIPDDELREAVDASYDTVVAKLPKKHRPAHGLTSRRRRVGGVAPSLGDCRLTIGGEYPHAVSSSSRPLVAPAHPARRHTDPGSRSAPHGAGETSGHLVVTGRFPL